MDPREALSQSQQLVDGVVAGLTPEHREMSTPCADYNVHELIDHFVGVNARMGAALGGAEMPGDDHDFLPEGPGKGWADAKAALNASLNDEVLNATHNMPFGEVSGNQVISVVAADNATHAWDLAQATGQSVEISDELADFALAVWQGVAPAETRPNPGFGAVVEVGDDASAADRLVAFTGRQP